MKLIVSKSEAYRNIALIIRGDNKQAGELKRLEASIPLSTYRDNKLDTKYSAYYNHLVLHEQLIKKVHTAALCRPR